MTVRPVFRGIVALCAGLALFAACPTVSRADPITSISISGTSNAPANGSSFTLDNFNSFTTSPSTTLTNPSASAINYSLGNTTVFGQFVSGSATLNSPGSQFTFNANGGSAVWDITNPATLGGVNSSSGFGSAITTTTATLISNTTGLNLPSGVWGFSTSISGVNISQGNPGSASFAPTVGDSVTLTAPSPNPPSGVPEPGSLVLWSVVGLAGAWYGRNNRQPKLAV